MEQQIARLHVDRQIRGIKGELLELEVPEELRRLQRAARLKIRIHAACGRFALRKEGLEQRWRHVFNREPAAQAPLALDVVDREAARNQAVAFGAHLNAGRGLSVDERRAQAQPLERHGEANPLIAGLPLEPVARERHLHVGERLPVKIPVDVRFARHDALNLVAAAQIRLQNRHVELFELHFGRTAAPETHRLREAHLGIVVRPAVRAHAEREVGEAEVERYVALLRPAARGR